ncbi:MAG TPA: DUF4349 domain-containing protein [Flavobacterium sp.]|nr:DUF4349 domain-containing protein [Flavobacterium sp.]
MGKNLLLLVFVFILTACGRGEKGSYEGAYAEEVVLAEVAPNKNKNYEERSNEESLPQKIIKNGNLQFETSDLNQTSQQIYDAAKKYKARIQSDREEKNYGTIYRDITLRVSNESFENLVNEISAGVGYFDHKNISSEDVTERFIDLEARLKAKKELESRYLELLKKANKISEILEIEKELTSIREEVESQEGQLNYLKNRVSMSTLEVRFYKKTSESGITQSYGLKMWHSVKSGFDLISSLFLGLLYIWPLLILVGLVLYYFNRRRNKK